MKLPLKRFRHAIGGVVIALVQFFFVTAPLFLIHFITDTLFFITYPIFTRIPSLRKQLLGNIRTAFGNEMSNDEVNSIAKNCIKGLFRMSGDIFHYGWPKNHGKLKELVTISGREHIEEALKEGKGIIGLGAHMVDFIMLSIRLAQSDLPFIVPTKAPRNELLRNKYIEWWAVCGLKYIDVDNREKARKEILDSLNDNMIVYLIADERKKRDGIPVPFFGKPALTAKGPALLSLTTGAPIVPIYINHSNGYSIEILPKIEFKPSGDDKKDIFDLTVKINKSIEDYIRKYPDQWIWLTPRWKM
jgi:Kdo2-lipid IVA lauroyltransferase/acyltransferase